MKNRIFKKYRVVVSHGEKSFRREDKSTTNIIYFEGQQMVAKEYSAGTIITVTHEIRFS